MPQLEVEIFGHRVRSGRWAKNMPVITFRPKTRYTIEEDCFDESFMQKVSQPPPAVAAEIPATVEITPPLKEAVPKPSTAWTSRKTGGK